MKFEDKHLELAAARIEAEMIDANNTDWGQGPKQAKGGVFAPADMAVLKRALHAYLDELIRTEESERKPSSDLVKVSNLLHRIGRID